MYDLSTAIGVDIGGTWMRAALFESRSKKPIILRKETQNHRPAQKIVQDLVGLIRDVESGSSDEVPVVGIGVPTTVSSDGRLAPCDNLPTMTHYPLRDVLQDHLSRTVVMENDANCFTLGEWRFGAGKGAVLLVGITLGTGVGMGMVHHGRLMRGAVGRVGEIWRSPLDLRADVAERVHLESIVSGKGLEEAYFRETGTKLGGAEIAVRAAAQDAAAIRVYADFSKCLANTIRWTVDLIDPDMIVVGGSVANSWEVFCEKLTATSELSECLIVRSELGELAPLYGAAILASQLKEVIS